MEDTFERYQENESEVEPEITDEKAVEKETNRFRHEKIFNKDKRKHKEMEGLDQHPKEKKVRRINAGILSVL